MIKGDNSTEYCMMMDLNAKQQTQIQIATHSIYRNCATSNIGGEAQN